jgi:hypothetical protein
MSPGGDYADLLEGINRMIGMIAVKSKDFFEQRKSALICGEKCLRFKKE